MSFKKRSKQIMTLMLIGGIYATSMFHTVFAIENTEDVLQPILSSQEELDYINKKSNEEYHKKFFNNLKESDEIRPYGGTFYTETIRSYAPSKTETKYDAFILAKFSFDTRGSNGGKLTTSVNQTKTVNWQFTGNIESEAGAFNVIKAKIGGSISKSSQVSKGVGGSMEYSIPAGKVGWVGVYAHGKRTVGQLRVEWWDRAGNHGFKNISATATIPYTKTQGTNIHFGRLNYN